MLILGGSDIVTNNIPHKGCQNFDDGSILLHSCWIIQNGRPKIVHTPLTLISSGSDILPNNVAHKGGRYFDYGFMLSNSAWITQDARL